MLSQSAITAHPALPAVLRRQAAAFLAVEAESPRVAAIFGTHQRYLLAQLAMSMVFRSERGSMLLTHFLEAVTAQGLASRNTADAFIKEMLKYGLVTRGVPGDDRRARPLVPSRDSFEAISLWVAIHLGTLDALDDGSRCIRYRSRPDLLARLHPRIVDRLFASRLTTRPEGAFSHFTWMNDGGLAMDKMMAMLADHPPCGGRIPTRITSLDELAEPLRITRAHLSRRIATAEKMGSVGWAGKRGASALWVSESFMAEYLAYQADKLARIDDAFEEVVAPGEGGPVSAGHAA